ncbi:54S ribosomal protein img2, mitochondrial [Zalaria obscura]|uniref:54S ribosomal protein img2, mitochondrial n=1 Tax=Zalaria obscura TaxID=2024903 RepID=A0ACC3SNL8_9PEZI
MALYQPVLSFLRPLGPPRPAAVRYFLRGLSQSAKPQAEAGVDRNLIASQTASPSYPPPNIKQLPRPKESRASHRTSQPTKIRDYPDRRPSPQHPSTTIPTSTSPSAPLPESECAPNLPYFVTRTPSNQLPIYLLRKRGGNLKQTRVKKIDGNIESLRDDLQQELGLLSKDCVVNSLTRHVVLKGHFKPQIQKFLTERKF